jgi:simple sugar transport system ATP-binding protein
VSGSAPAASLRGLTRRYPGVTACDAIDLDLHGGEVHVLLGENGAGKSTLIAMLSGIAQPDSGTIAIDGGAVRLASPRAALGLGIGTVFQNSNLVPSLTVAENLLLGGPWWRRPRRGAVQERLAETCGALGFTIVADSTVASLSLAERQLVEIVRALWHGGRMLVLDEPTARLAPHASVALGAMMRRVAAQGVAVVFVTHRLAEALDTGDRITVLRRGRVTERIDPQTLHTAPRAVLSARVLAAMFGTAPETAPIWTPHPLGPTVLEAPGIAVRSGEIFGIGGIEGNGQKALAETLAGYRHGDVRLDGRSLAGQGVDAREALGLRYLTDDRIGEGTVGALSIALNLLLKRIGQVPFWRWGLPRRTRIAAHARERVAAYGIRAASAAQPVATLSGGNVQRLLLARELEDDPRAVIYDKPTAGLDVRGTHEAWARIRAAAARGAASLLISSDLDELLALCDRIGVMRRCALVGTVANGPDARAQLGRLISGDVHGA